MPADACPRGRTFVGSQRCSAVATDDGQASQRIPVWRVRPSASVAHPDAGEAENGHLIRAPGIGVTCRPSKALCARLLAPLAGMKSLLDAR
ncbi:hypothetical protein WOLCODRAFT_155003 [Wolfiporia cocos MD-104 SS10]|uniref:Uncharacterized protein n=1 Tax=Wolfiporia cocos (strain MD-104) TaxID=742152 RepID=A0A2H3JS58_WOLCO|nr:hypothetical protein WOLCODRAFT_155003 [Wolfiporia cocos MD-104 SS10]